ncbi:MAG TPA: hypothetical protein VMF65_08745, partial [Acidimicrobiales bacterium]|nr:hypothetical protein [Acidimicrobiales bacterium]
MAVATGTRHLTPTPSQTAGPFVSIGTEWDAGGRLVPETAKGAISIVGCVLDGAGSPVTDAMLEFWQADPAGQFPSGPAGSRFGASPSGRSPSGRSPSGGSPSGGSPSGGSWTGFARALTDEQGRYRLVTLKPGPVPGAGGQPQAPHIDVS